MCFFNTNAFVCIYLCIIYRDLRRGRRPTTRPTPLCSGGAGAGGGTNRSGGSGACPTVAAAAGAGGGTSRSGGVQKPSAAAGA